MKRVLLILLLACCLLIAPAAAAGGSGTAADPYIIETPAELQSIQNNLGAYYKLENDLDLSAITTWYALGTPATPFFGNLDGNGKTISGLTIAPLSSYYGLFGALGSGASISNLVFNDIKFDTGNNYLPYVGILCGTTVGSGDIYITSCDFYNCYLYNHQGYACGIVIGGTHGTSKVHIANCNINDCLFTTTPTNINNLGSGSLLIGGCYSSSVVDISNCNIINCIVNNGCFLTYHISPSSSVTVSNVNVINCITSREIYSGFIGLVDTSGDVILSNCNINQCTYYSGNSLGGYISSLSSVNSISIDGCSISDSCLIAVNDVGGIIPFYNALSGCTVTDCNLYGSTIYNIAPTGSYDSTSTASGITNVAGRYLYASGLTATPNGKTISYALEGRQGSTTIEAAQGTAQSWAWTFGDGQTSTAAQDTTHTYAAPGSYQTSLTLKNYLDTTGVTVRTQDYNILPIPPTVSASAQTLKLGQSVTLNAVGTLFSTIQWQYSTNNGASWQDITGATANNYVWTPEAGSYQVRAHVTAVGTGYTADSEVLIISVYAPPSISDVSASPTVVTAWPQQITLSATVTDSGPDATTYQWQQQVIGTTTWQDISGATTATYTASQTINSATQYRLIATGTGGQTTSDTVWIYPKSTATVSAATGTPTTSITLSADKTYGATTIQWEYSTDGASTWQDISGATSATYSWTPQNAASYAVRAEVTYGQYTLYSTYAYFAIYNPPSITAVTVSPTIGQYTETITLSAEVSDSGPAPTTYQWQQSPQNQNTWTNIQGATTAQWIGQLTFTGATDFRLIATGTGGTTTSATTTYYIALPGEIQSLTATPSVVALPGSTTLSATGANVITWEWQELISGTWTTIGYGASLQESLTTEGTYTYRVLATGADGTTITSETVEVLAGYAPTVSITSPADNVQFPTQSQITVSADITGTDVVYEWDFGSLQTVNGGNTNPTWVTYLVDGQYTITLRAESIFGSTSDSVTIISGVMPRPMATEKFDAISTAPVTAFVESFNVPQGEILDLPAVFGSLTAPMSDLLPDGMFMVIVFGVIFIMLWIMTKNTAVPSIIGLIFGGFILALLPASYNGAAVVILAISIVGGVIRVFIPPK